MVVLTFTEIRGATHRARGNRLRCAPIDQMKKAEIPMVPVYPTVPMVPLPPYQEAAMVPTAKDQGRDLLAW